MAMLDFIIEESVRRENSGEEVIPGGFRVVGALQVQPATKILMGVRTLLSCNKKKESELVSR